MKTFDLFIAFICLMLLMPFLPGCGDEEQLKSNIKKQATPKAVAEKKQGSPAGDPLKAPQPEGPVMAQGVEQTVSEIDEIIINNQGYATDKKGPVKFSHGRHYKEYKTDCVQCHHVYQDGENLWKHGDKVEKCVTCHDQTETQGGVLKLQTAFHKNCRGCHIEGSSEGKEAPYKKCSRCHG